MTEQIYVGSVFAAGLLSFFSPCILPLLPVYLAYLGSTSGGNGNGSGSGVERIESGIGSGNGDRERNENRERSGNGSGAGGVKTSNRKGLGTAGISPVLIGRTLLFILGLSTVFVLLGFGAGALGGLFNSTKFIVACGIVVILFGVYQTGIVKLSFLEREKRLDAGLQHRRGLFGAFLLGFTFSFGWTPCIGPVLAAVISLSASGGSLESGVIYMAVYALGLSIPFLIMAVFSNLLLIRVKRIYKYMNRLKAVSGVVLILMGLLLVTGKLNAITAYFQF